MFYFMFLIVVTKEQRAVLMISSMKTEVYWGIRFSLSIITLLHDWHISLFVENRKKHHLHHAKEFTVWLFYSALNERTLAVNWKITSSIIKLLHDPLCVKSIVVYPPSKFLLQPQSMILTYSYLKPLKKSKGRLAECHIIITMGKSIASASP